MRQGEAGGFAKSPERLLAPGGPGAAAPAAREVRVEDDPLDFYANLDQMVAVGDLVLMQNDWPDNYA